MQPVRVLLVEDDEGDADFIQELLAESENPLFFCQWVDRVEEALAKLSSEKFDIILSDLSLPDSRGTDTVYRLLDVAPLTPVIVLTGLDDSEIGLEMVQAGAQDYLLKGKITSYTLARAIPYAMQRKHMLDRLSDAALHDQLTGLPNRTLFMDRLVRAIGRTQRYPNYQFAVLFIDLDRFKIINDSLGHLIGDELLINIARRLEHFIRSGDTVARLGGDEFIILLDEIHDEKEVFHVAERIHAELELPFNLQGHEVYSSGSIGIALSIAGYTKAEDILRDADTAMYHAKAQERGTYVIFDPEMHEKVKKLMHLERDLRQAINRQEFVVYYQPIIALKNSHSQLMGFEALIRWQHPQQGLLLPQYFLEAAKETGLLTPISYWALQEACAQVKKWQMTYQKSLRLHVNLASKQFSLPDLKEQVEKILRKTEFNPALLTLELTEDVLVTDAEIHNRILTDLKELGIKLYLDDFGTGYSSLSCLYRFPIDAIKIDLRISQVPAESVQRDQKSFIEAMMSMAHHMGLNVTVEGVETSQQLALLKSHHCEYAQGYYFSPPLAVADVESLFHKNQIDWST